MNRRSYLAGAVTVSLAGCLSSNVPDAENSSNRSDGGDNESVTDDGSSAAGDEPPLAGTYDNFESLAEWNAIEGSLDVDENRSYVGSQSALLHADESTDRVVIARELDEPEDCSSVVPGLAVTTDANTVPRIQLFDGDGDRIDYGRAMRGNLSFMRYNFGVTSVEGDPDPTDVREIRIVHRLGSSESNRMWCDDLHFVPRPETGKVMLQFDDGYETDYTEGFRVLEEYGYPAVTFVNPGRIGRGPFLSVSQAEELQDAGWTIANHAYTHPNLRELSGAEQGEEIRRGKEWLLEHGFDRGARYFAYPFGQYDDTTLDIVKKHHTLGFAGGPPAQGHAVNPVLCSRIGDPSAEEAIEIFDLTAEMGGISSVFYHLLEDELLEDFEVAMAHLHKLESADEIEIIMPRDLEDTYAF